MVAFYSLETAHIARTAMYAPPTNSGGTQTSMYNALGQRIEDVQPDGSSSTMTLTYPRDAFGHKTGIFDQRPSIGWTGWDIWFAQVAGQRINMGGSTSWLLHSDALGSSTMETDQTGAVDWDGNFYPWGQPWHSGNGEVSFADLGYPVNEPVLPSATRGYNPTLGRWMTPDPGGMKVVSLSDPQTWNMYAYAHDNPVTFNDPSGLQTNADRIEAHYGWSPGEHVEKVHGVRSQADEDSVQGQSWWKSLTSAIALGIARISPSAARKIYEAANPGQKVPFDTVLQRYYDMAHIKALADGGTNEAGNLVPMEHDAHMAQHMENGDFARWAGRAKQDIEDAVKMEEGAAKQSLNDAENGAEELINDPAQAIEDAITSAEEAGEEPFPP